MTDYADSFTPREIVSELDRHIVAQSDAKRAVAEVDKALAKNPQVSGGGAQQTPGLDNDAVRTLDQAEDLEGLLAAGHENKRLSIHRSEGV